VRRRDFIAGALACARLRAQPSGRPEYLPLADARPVLEDFKDELPSALKAPFDAAAWLQWETARDREIRSRLEQGDADSIVNLVLYGTSFTAHPRLTPEGAGDSEATGRLIVARIQDFAKAVLHADQNGPGQNERLRFARAWLKQSGINFADPDAEKRIAVLLLENTRRVLREQQSYSSAIDAAKQHDSAGNVFVTRSSLYRDRGLSLDTSFRPCYGIERALDESRRAGLLGEIRRAAIVGPGLDFTDKRSGYDFYPVQTLQPFALIDSLRRLRLAGPSLPAVAILDLSSRVLDHVRAAVARAQRGSVYTVQIPLAQDTRWLAQTTSYWRRFGSEIGAMAPALSAPAGTKVDMRAVRIRSEAVRLLQPQDLNVVLQRLKLEQDRKFDLIVATNIFLYYEPFEQALALQNAAAMLRKGALLLSNNALPEVHGVPMRAAGETSVPYSDDPDDGDHVVWYQRT